MSVTINRLLCYFNFHSWGEHYFVTLPELRYDGFKFFIEEKRRDCEHCPAKQRYHQSRATGYGSHWLYIRKAKQ